MSIHLEVAKKTLLDLKAEYQTRINTIADHIQNPRDDMNKDWEEQAVAIRQNDTRQLLAAEARQTLIYINDALSRIESGDYTKCEVCGEPIQEERLNAVPYATLCMQHAE